MNTPARRLLAAFAFGTTVLSGTLASAALGGAAHAQGIYDQPKYAAIVVDAKTGEVLYSLRPDAQRYPASITKIMTLYMTFEALANGRLSPNERIGVSSHAASQAPSKLGLKPGETISVDDAIRAAAVHSANDMAVALAERVGGNEDHFAQMMTTRAHELGMSHSSFINANGLPDRRGNNLTSARDMAILSRAVMRDFPQYYSYFGLHQFSWNGRLMQNHNHLLEKMPGVDGLKTGFTNAAGFNLAASAVRDGRRLITVVLGGPSHQARDANVETLLNAGFDVLNRRARGQTMTIAANLGVPDDSGAFARASVQREEPRAYQMAQAEPARALPTVVAASMAPIPDPVVAPRPAIGEPMVVAQARPPIIRVSAPAPKVAVEEGDGGEDCAPAPAKHGRHHHHRHAVKACSVEPTKAAVQIAKADAAEDHCASVKKSRRKACETKAVKAEAKMEIAKADAADAHCAKAKKSRRKACELKAVKSEESVEIAKAENADAHCAKTKKSRRKACEAKAEVQVASADPKLRKSLPAGDYGIQVGSYTDRHQAQAHMEKVSEKFSHLVASAAGQVSHASGNYRVRFKGFSSAAAKAACQKLSAKGERCMVVASI